MSNLKERVADFVGANADTLAGIGFGLFAGAAVLFGTCYGYKIGYSCGSMRGVMGALMIASEKYPDINLAKDLLNDKS